MAEKEYSCPKCRAVLELSESRRCFDFIFASWIRCLECDVEILIKDDVPTIPPRMQLWRPRRDLNPCYRRERDRLVRNILKQRSTDGSQMRVR